MPHAPLIYKMQFLLGFLTLITLAVVIHGEAKVEEDNGLAQDYVSIDYLGSMRIQFELVVFQIWSLQANYRDTVRISFGMICLLEKAVVFKCVILEKKPYFESKQERFFVILNISITFN